MIEGNALVMHTIYRDSTDYPGMFVGRAFRISGGKATPESRPFAVGRTIEEIRAAIPPGSDHCIGREPGDEPQIVETWV